jgi:hypothetical protein
MIIDMYDLRKSNDINNIIETATLLPQSQPERIFLFRLGRVPILSYRHIPRSNLYPASNRRLTISRCLCRLLSLIIIYRPRNLYLIRTPLNLSIPLNPLKYITISNPPRNRNTVNPWVI